MTDQSVGMTKPDTVIITKVASSENTPELQSFWSQRFSELFEYGQFSLSPKTLQLLEQPEHLQPFTPQGDIHLLKLTNSSGIIDDGLLQSTIDTAVRFLDNAIQASDFTSSALSLVKGYRKIAIGIADFEEYADLQGISELELIDSTGKLLSNAAYRASESLAEEKGAFEKWEECKYILRPKTFEYWYNLETGEIKDSLFMFENFTNDTIRDSRYEIIPRRNSHILLLPPDIRWQIWSDRSDESAVEESPLPSPVSEVDKIQENSEPELESEPEPHLEPATTKAELSPSDQPILKLISVPQLRIQQPQQHAALPEPVTQNIESEKPEQLNEEDGITTPFDTDSKPVSQPISQIISEPPYKRVEGPAFQIGELVEITDAENEYFEQTCQVIDYVFTDDEYRFTLRGTLPDIEKRSWSEDQLESVDLFRILERVNVPTEEDYRAPSLAVFIGLFFVEDKKILIDISDTENWKLPGIYLEPNTIPEQLLPHYLREEFGIELRNILEIGSAVQLESSHESFEIHLAFTGTLNLPTTLPDSLAWKDFKTVQFSGSNALRVVCNKYNRLLMKQKVSDVKPVEAPVVTPESTSPSVSYYTVKLEKLIESNVFGQVFISFRYGAHGPAIASLESTKLDSDTRLFADSLIVLINYILSLKTSSKVIAKMLEPLSQKPSDLPMNTLLKILVEVLTEVPDSVSAINTDLLVH